jgi:thiol-disulfide isomerase/thioredoxin
MKKLLLILILAVSTIFAQNVQQLSFDIVDTNNNHIQIKGTNDGLDIAGAKGKVVFLEFFGHRCPPCLKTIPHLIDLKNKYKDKVEIIAIEVQGLSHSQLQAFAKSKGINYHAISDEKSGIFTNYIAQRAKWQGSIPFTLVLDTNGDVQYIQAGLIPEKALFEITELLLNKNSNNNTTPKNQNKTK